jgi:hypothetical protein
LIPIEETNSVIISGGSHPWSINKYHFIHYDIEREWRVESGERREERGEGRRERGDRGRQRETEGDRGRQRETEGDRGRENEKEKRERGRVGEILRERE